MIPCKTVVVVLAYFSWAFLAAPGRAQTACQGSTGPDVIVGDITGPSNYSAVGSVEALSLGTYSCNMGTANVQWQASNNRHPVIGGELYRYKVVNGAGRFEQLGRSWLKHGFFALSNNLCCTGCSGDPNGTFLGVRCSDPYSSARNGTQSGLGPRWQVNASTGVFTYPPPTPSGGNTGRLEVDIGDLEASSPTGTRYFGNAQYVTQDDAQAGNGNNNSSYREVTVTGSGTAWTFGFSGTTQREIPAIKAWPVAESGVTVRNVQLPGEGLLILGYKTTNLGGGQYHYEYALYNMNSDDSVRSFSLPIPAGVTITNAGFHDVAYRGGDGGGGVNYDGTDWPFTNASGTGSWSTSTFAQNANANALRWATTYNFRFDANSPPMTGTITLGLFKTGGSALTTADVPFDPNPPPDTDGDGIGDPSDNCPLVPNTNQANADGDSFGDVCDACTDTDGDGYGNPGYAANTCATDNCPTISNPSQADNDGDSMGDACDPDDDNDGVADTSDNCPFVANANQLNTDGDAFGDVCDSCTDTDHDGYGNPGYPANTCTTDNCPTISNPSQANNDGDSMGDACDPDDDNDGVADTSDNCPFVANANQANNDGDSMGDACDTDDDNDGTPDASDGCPFDPLKISPGACGCGVPDTDSDGDGTANCVDGCPNDAAKIAPGQCGCSVPDTDSDGDGTANCVDGCPNDPNKIAPGVCGCGTPDTGTDGDGDGVADCVDNCSLANPGQEDCNQNAIGDVCDLASGTPDCNMNGIPDSCDIVSGTSQDGNLNGIPDECQQQGGISFCFGDGTGAPCPCGNNGGSGRGCANSTAGSTGALLTATGNTVPDTVVLTSSGERPTALSIFLQGNVNLAPGVFFGDGRRCAGGALKRIGNKSAVGGVAVYPQAGDPSISTRSAALGDPIPAGALRYYQVYYRDPVPTFCPDPPGNTFNATQARQLMW